VIAAGSETVNSAKPTLKPTLAVTSAVPLATRSTSPVGDTVATAGLELDQVTAGSASRCRVAIGTVAVGLHRLARRCCRGIRRVDLDDARRKGHVCSTERSARADDAVDLASMAVVPS
jgi:hypothetical protein